MSYRNRYYITIDDLAAAHGPDPALAWDGAGHNDLAAAVQEGLRSAQLFERWRAMQEDPEAVDPGLAAIDPQATAQAKVADLHIDLELVTALPMRIVRQRLNWLIGSHWKLHDMRSA